MPSLLMAAVPGLQKVVTGLIKKHQKNIVLETVEQLRELCVEADVTLNACQMSVDVFRFDLGHLTADVSDHAAATSFLLVAWKSDV